MHTWLEQVCNDYCPLYCIYPFLADLYIYTLFGFDWIDWHFSESESDSDSESRGGEGSEHSFSLLAHSLTGYTGASIEFSLKPSRSLSL